MLQYSLTKESPHDQDSPGRSGARFLESYDVRYVVKTIGSEEVAEMHRILKDYHQVGRDYHQVGREYHQVGREYHQVGREYNT